MCTLVGKLQSLCDGDLTLCDGDLTLCDGDLTQCDGGLCWHICRRKMSGEQSTGVALSTSPTFSAKVSDIQPPKGAQSFTEEEEESTKESEAHEVTCEHAHTRAHMHMHVFTHTHTHTHACTRTHTYMCMLVCTNSWTPAHTHLHLPRPHLCRCANNLPRTAQCDQRMPLELSATAAQALRRQPAEVCGCVVGVVCACVCIHTCIRLCNVHTDLLLGSVTSRWLACRRAVVGLTVAD